MLNINYCKVIYTYFVCVVKLYNLHIYICAEFKTDCNI